MKKIIKEKRGKNSEKLDLQSLEHLEGLSSEHFEMSGVVPTWLKQEVERAQKWEEFKNYVELLNNGVAQFGCEFEDILMLYTVKHHGEVYWMNLCSSCRKKEK